MNSLCEHKLNKKFLKYALLLGGVAIISLHIGKSMLKKKRNEHSYNLIDCYISKINNFDDLEGLVYSNGTQVILDETSGVVSIVFINAEGKAEIIEINDSDLSELIYNRFFDTAKN